MEKTTKKKDVKSKSASVKKVSKGKSLIKKSTIKKTINKSSSNSKKVTLATKNSVEALNESISMVKRDFPRIKMLNTPIDVMTMNHTIDFLDSVIKAKKQCHHTVVNAGKMVLMHENRQLFDSVVTADVINADGQAIVWASKLLRKPLPERVAGIDVMQNLVKLAYDRNYKVFLFGAKEEVVSKVADLYSKKYSPSIIAGYRNGYFKKEDESSIAEQIAKSKANILFVAISSPVKEIFLYKYKDKLKNVNVIMGVGGSFDVVAGKVTRAPLWMQKFGLEWFYRMMQEPRRMFKRYMFGNLKFIYMVFRELIGLKNQEPAK